MAGDLPGGCRSCLGAPIAQGPFQPPMLADALDFFLQPVSCLLALVNLVEVVTSKPAPRARCSVALETLMTWMWHQQGFLTCGFCGFFFSPGKTSVFTLCIKVNWLLRVFLVVGWSLETSHPETRAGGCASLLCCASVC